MKNPLLSRIYLVKKRQFCQNYNILWDKKSKKCIVFPIFHENIANLMAICYKKKHSFSKKPALMPIFCQKTSILSKTYFFHLIFENFPWKTRCCHAHSWYKKRQFCHNYTAKKSIGERFFPIFHGKINALVPLFCWKNVHFLTTTLLSCPYFVKKTFILPKTKWSRAIFFKIVMKNPLLSSLYLSKNVNSVKTKVYYGL